MAKKIDPNSGSGDQKLLKFYITLMLAEKPLSRKQLEDLLGCSNQTVGRLIVKLEELMNSPSSEGKYGLINVIKSGKNSYYQLHKPKGRMPLTPEGLHQMEMCRAFMTHLLTQKELEQLNDSLGRARSNLSNRDADKYSIIDNAYGITKGSIDYTPFQKQLTELKAAMLGKNCCEISYQKNFYSEPETIYFIPQKLIAYHEAMNVYGWTVSEKGNITILKPNSPTNLSVHRIKSVKIQKDRIGDKLPEATIQNDDTFGYMKNFAKEPFKVRIRFSKDVATYIMERKWSGDQKIEINEDNSIVLEFTSTSSPEVISFVLGFGPAAELIEPQNLRAEVKDKISQMAQMYN